MGDTLSRPIVDKHSERHESEFFRVGASGMQGWRRGMEDAHTCALQLEGAPPGYAFFGVFDGHCGPKVARYCGENLCRRLLRDPAFSEGRYEDALAAAFLGVDQDLLNDPQLRSDPSGCTAVTALVTPTHIYCANAGDSRCVLSKSGAPVPLSTDHKPTNDGEIKRIQKAGAFVSCGRVNGNLALSRAIGDFEFKQNKTLPPAQQAITAAPEVTVHVRGAEDEFLVLACDGIWDVLSNEQLVAFVKRGLEKTDDLAAICEEAFDHCLAPSAPGLGCDNMTMVLVQLKSTAVAAPTEGTAK